MTEFSGSKASEQFLDRINTLAQSVVDFNERFGRDREAFAIHIQGMAFDSKHTGKISRRE